ncbi:unnamed protein product [Moneuplotes crassus]|uniref:Uncharacterized protein n=1 Tax=Euplotes crassus TaxID=5936 RepID=A0AAD1XZ19_EUPCR|nr:unnamed protein product [Moneuplotes crassus]
MQKRMNTSLLQSNEVITTLLTEIQKGANNSMMSLHKLIYSLENKISVLVKKEQKNSNRGCNEYEDGSPHILNCVDDIGHQIKNSSNTLQDTHVFLKQALNSINKSLYQKKSEFLEPETEELEHNLIDNENINQFRTCDNNLNFYPNKKLDDDYCIETFDYNKGKRAFNRRKASKDTSKSPRIQMNAQNVKNKYAIQAEKFSSKAQRKSQLQHPTVKNQGSLYTHRGASPNYDNAYNTFHVQHSPFTIQGGGSYASKAHSQHNRNVNKSYSGILRNHEDPAQSRITASEMKGYKESRLYKAKNQDNAYSSKPRANPKTHRKSKSYNTSGTRKEGYSGCKMQNKQNPPNYSSLYKKGKKSINYHELLQQMIDERKTKGHY